MRKQAIRKRAKRGHATRNYILVAVAVLVLVTTVAALAISRSAKAARDAEQELQVAFFGDLVVRGKWWCLRCPDKKDPVVIEKVNRFLRAVNVRDINELMAAVDNMSAPELSSYNTKRLAEINITLLRARRLLAEHNLEGELILVDSMVGEYYDRHAEAEANAESEDEFVDITVGAMTYLAEYAVALLKKRGLL